MCKCKMGKAGATSQFDLADPTTVLLMVAGAAGANAVVNPIINAIYKPGSGKTAPKILKPALKAALGLALIMKSGNDQAEAVGAGMMIAGATEAVVNILPSTMRLQLGIPEPVESVGAAEVFELSMPMATYAQNTAVGGTKAGNDVY